jgi:hypothetical protein
MPNDFEIDGYTVRQCNGIDVEREDFSGKDVPIHDASGHE